MKIYKNMNGPDEGKFEIMLTKPSTISRSRTELVSMMSGLFDNREDCENALTRITEVLKTLPKADLNKWETFTMTPGVYLANDPSVEGSTFLVIHTVGNICTNCGFPTQSQGMLYYWAGSAEPDNDYGSKVGDSIKHFWTECDTCGAGCYS